MIRLWSVQNIEKTLVSLQTKLPANGEHSA